MKFDGKFSKFLRCLSAILLLTLATPAATLAKDGANVREMRVEERNLDCRYPMVTLADSLAARRINERIMQDVEAFTRSVRSKSLLNPKMKGKLTYRVTCNKGGSFSFILRHEKTYPNRETAIYEQGYIFKLKSGSRASFADVLAIARVLGKEWLYQLGELNRQIFHQLNRGGVVPLPSFTGISVFPDNLYMDEKFRFHILIPPGIAADKSAGVVDINIDEEDW